MGRALTPDQRRELLGAYALGALADDDERAQVEALVLSDADARAELHTLQLGVAWLDHASTRAPMHVWKRIVDELDVEGASPPAPVVPLVHRRSARWMRVTAIAAVVAAVLVASIGLLVARVDQDRSPSVAAIAARVAEQPGSTSAALVASDGSRSGEVVVAADGRAYLVWSSGPTPVSDARTYQLWALTPDGPRSAGLLGADPADRAFRLEPATSGVAVTREPRGGSPAPTGTPVAVANLA